MAHFDEDRYALDKRVERLLTEHAWTEDPPSRTRHLVTNVRTFATDLETRCASSRRCCCSAAEATPATRDRVRRPRRRLRAGEGGLPAGRTPHHRRRVGAAHAEPGDLPVSVRQGWLEGKRALVVGAGSGIGRAVRDAFVAEGAHVAVMEIDAWKCATLADEVRRRRARRRSGARRQPRRGRRRRRPVRRPRRARQLRRRVRLLPRHPRPRSTRELMPRSTSSFASTWRRSCRA